LFLIFLRSRTHSDRSGIFHIHPTKPNLKAEAKAKAYNTCRAPQAAYRYFRGAGHATG